MPLIPDTREIIIDSSPESIELSVTLAQISSDLAGFGIDRKEKYIISGIHTLTGAVGIIPDSGATKYMEFNFEYRASLTTNTATGKTFSIFGFNFTNAQAQTNAIVKCVYNGSTWTVNYLPNFRDGNIVEERHLQEGVVTEDKIGSGAVTEGKIGTGAVASEKLKVGAVTTEKINNQSVTGDKILDNTIGTIKIQDSSVTNPKLGEMFPGTVKVGGEGFRPEDVNMNIPGSGSMLLAQDYGKRPEAKQMSGQGRLDKDGVFRLLPGTVTNPYLGQYSVTPDKADDTMVSEVVPVMVDFADASRNRLRMAFKGEAWAVWGSVEKAIVGNGTITIKNDDDTVIGVIDTNNGDAKDTTSYSVATSNGQFDKFDTLKFEAAGSTVGKVLLSVMVVKRP